MQLDTETAKTIRAPSKQCNAVAEESTRRVVELMQEAIEYRERIAELENALNIAIAYCDHAMHDSGQYSDERESLIRVLGRNPQ